MDNPIAENSLSPRESMQIIADTIAKTKEDIRLNSFCFLLWGWLISIASLLFFVLQHFTSFSYYFLVFPLAVVPGIVITVVWFVKNRTTATLSHLTFFLSRLWLVMGLGFIVVVFLNVVQGMLPFAYSLLLAAIGTCVSGLVMRFRPLQAGGVVLFAACMGTLFIPDDYQSLLNGAAILLGYLIPGYLLKNHKS
jgi:hypothetical protein